MTNSEPQHDAVAAAIISTPDIAAMMLAAVGASARDLAANSIAPNTRRAYSSALARLNNWLDGRPLNDATLATYLGVLFDSGRSAGSAAVTVAAIKFQARVSNQPTPIGAATERVLAGYRRQARERGRGQAAPMTVANLAAIIGTARTPRRTKRGVESDAVAARRALVHGGLRRSEVAALRAGDVESAAHVDGAVLVTVRSSKTNVDGVRIDKRLVKGEPAAAVRKLQDAAPGPEASLIGLGDRQIARMVAHYAAGATAERGAVARYL